MRRINYYRLRRSLIKNFSEEDMEFLHALQGIAAKYDDKDVPEKVGYQVLGPMLLGYSSWLHREAVEKNADVIMFLSREGKILNEAYEQLYGTEEFNTAYVNVSRLSVFKAHVIYTHCWNDLVEMFIALLRGNPSINAFLELLGLNESMRKTCPIPLDQKLIEINDKDKLYEFIMDKGYEYFATQNELLKKYLYQKGIDSGQVIISDIGYSGTMQLFLSGLSQDIKYFGRYIAMRNRKYYTDERYKALDRKGYWIELDEEGSAKSSMRDLTISAFERLFFSDEGTTTGYVENNGIVEPQKVSDQRRSSQIINMSHKTALQYLKDAFTTIDIEAITKINHDVFFLPYVNFGVYPSSETVEFYKNFSFINGTIEFTFIPGKSFLFYLLHPVQAYREISLASKIIWLKGLLRIPFPYYRFLRFILEHTELEGSFSRREIRKKLTGKKKRQ